MKKACVILCSSMFLIFLAGNALAVPIAGSYSTGADTLDEGVWQEDFDGNHPGTGGSSLLAYGVCVTCPIPPGEFYPPFSYQWALFAESGPAEAYTTGGPPGAWDYQTPYSGQLAILGSLVSEEDEVVFFDIEAMNYNVGYQQTSRGLFLVWEFVGEGYWEDTDNGDIYLVSFDAEYAGYPYVEFDDETGWMAYHDDMIGNVIMDMEIEKIEVPEPTTMLLLGIGLIGLAGVSRRKFKK